MIEKNKLIFQNLYYFIVYVKKSFLEYNTYDY